MVSATIDKSKNWKLFYRVSLTRFVITVRYPISPGKENACNYHTGSIISHGTLFPIITFSTAFRCLPRKLFGSGRVLPRVIDALLFMSLMFWSYHADAISCSSLRRFWLERSASLSSSGAVDEEPDVDRAALGAGNGGGDELRPWPGAVVDETCDWRVMMRAACFLEYYMKDELVMCH